MRQHVKFDVLSHTSEGSPNQSATRVKAGTFAAATFQARFVAVVVHLAQRLPVGFIPEQSTVTSVRLDVIHHVSGGGVAIGCAYFANRPSTP